MATYYIDVINGKNENDGLSENSPLADYTHLVLKAGDSVLFKRGSFIRRRLQNTQGEEGKPITFGAYGEGERPTFCTSVDVSAREIWKEEEKNIWVLDAEISEVANFIFNNSDLCATLRWEKEELSEQGDFYDNKFGVSIKKGSMEGHRIYMYSEKNPGEYYKSIECAVALPNNITDNGHDMIFKDLRFINSGVHALAGEKKSRNVLIDNCVFECIGGAVYDKSQKIRYGNAVEFWNVAENIEVKNCIFNNIFDSAVTHQGGAECEYCVGFNIHHNTFIKCGMAAYEQRDLLPVASSFCDNLCIDAGEGFSKNGEEMPRFSEIWPEPMGHHVFLWRINTVKEECMLEIKNNIFYNAPYGAAIYSIICRGAEEKTELSGNTYYTENTELLNRWHGENFKNFEDFKEKEKNSKYEKVNIEKYLKF